MSKFNDMLNKIIFEETNTEEESENIRNIIQTNNQFYNNYLAKLSEKYNVISTKARFDTFQIYGYINNIINFFNNFKVDKSYIENPKEFQILCPMYCVIDNNILMHQMNDPMNERYFTDGNYVPTREDLINFTHRDISGIWKMFKTDDNQEIKTCAPNELQNILTDTLGNDVVKTNPLVIIEFKINSMGMENAVWEENSYYWSGDAAVENVAASQQPLGLQCKAPIIKDEYENKNLATKTINYDIVNKAKTKKAKVNKA